MKKSFALVLPAIGAALIAVFAQITIPIGPVPFALQNMAIGLVATIFHRKEALLAVALYLLLGAIGLPVFAGGSGGFQALVGPNAGYLWFYLFYALITASLTSKNSSFLTIFLSNLLGDAFVFVGGVLGLMFLAGFQLDKAITVGVIPFILPDLIKLIAISFISRTIFKSLKDHPYFKN